MPTCLFHREESAAAAHSLAWPWHDCSIPNMTAHQHAVLLSRASVEKPGRVRQTARTWWMVAPRSQAAEVQGRTALAAAAGVADGGFARLERAGLLAISLLGSGACGGGGVAALAAASAAAAATSPSGSDCPCSAMKCPMAASVRCRACGDMLPPVRASMIDAAVGSPAATSASREGGTADASRCCGSDVARLAAGPLRRSTAPSVSWGATGLARSLDVSSCGAPPGAPK